MASAPWSNGWGYGLRPLRGVSSACCRRAAHQPLRLPCVRRGGGLTCGGRGCCARARKGTLGLASDLASGGVVAGIAVDWSLELLREIAQRAGLPWRAAGTPVGPSVAWPWDAPPLRTGWRCSCWAGGWAIWPPMSWRRSPRRWRRRRVRRFGAQMQMELDTAKSMRLASTAAPPGAGGEARVPGGGGVSRLCCAPAGGGPAGASGLQRCGSRQRASASSVARAWRSLRTHDCA